MFWIGGAWNWGLYGVATLAWIGDGFLTAEPDLTSCTVCWLTLWAIWPWEILFVKFWVTMVCWAGLVTCVWVTVVVGCWLVITVCWAGLVNVPWTVACVCCVTVPFAVCGKCTIYLKIKQRIRLDGNII